MNYLIIEKVGQYQPFYELPLMTKILNWLGLIIKILYPIILWFIFFQLEDNNVYKY